MSNISQWTVAAGGNNAAPPNGWPEGQSRSSVNDCAREVMAATRRWYGDMQGSLVTAGTSNAYTVTTNSAHANLVDQSPLVVRFDRANTGAATFKVDSLTAKGLVKNGGEALAENDILADSLGIVVYNATNDNYEVFLPPKQLTGAAVSATGAVPVAGGHQRLRVTVTGNATVDVDIDAITLEDTSGTAYRAQGVDLTLDMGTTGAGGRDTGAEQANSWYGVWIIRNPLTATVSGVLVRNTAAFGAAPTAPVMPADFTFKAFIGHVRNDGSSNLYRTIQRGRRAQWIVGTNPSVGIVMASGDAGNASVPTYVAVSTADFAPSTAESIEISLQINSVNDQASSIALVAPNGSYGTTSGTNPPFAAFSSNENLSDAIRSCRTLLLLLEAANVYWASSVSGPTANTNQLLARGWIEI